MYEAIRNKDGMSAEMLVQLTAHEGLRLFQDRLTTDEERKVGLLFILGRCCRSLVRQVLARDAW